VAGDGLVVELLSGLGVLQRGGVAIHGCADGSPADAVAGLVEAHQRAFEAVCAGEKIAGRNVHVYEREAAGDGGAEGPFAVDIFGGEAGAICFDEEAADAIVLVFNFGPDDSDVGDGAGGDPHLFAVENVAVAGFAGGSGHAAGVGAEAGFGEAEAAELFAFSERGEPGVLLVFRAEGVDGIHDERGLDADEAAEAGVAALQLLHDEAVFDVGHAGAAVTLEVCAEEAQLAHDRDEFAGEAAFAEAVFDDGNEIIVDEIARCFADEELVFTETCVEMEEVYVLKLEAHCAPVVRIKTPNCKASRHITWREAGRP
jgi:hypothetical protein